jgi:hypothetical protein
MTNSNVPMRRRFLLGLLAVPFLPLRRAGAAGPVIEVWTGPSCSCCHDWLKHLEANGFGVQAHDGGNSEARARLGMPINFGSCHTGLVEGCALEGHVPAREIHRLLAERPDAIGLSVPAMPRGSPGMDGAVYGGVRDPYDVLVVARDGRASVFQSYREPHASTAAEQPAVAGNENRGVGIVQSVDAASGSLTIAHEPMAALGWPAMTMAFKVDRVALLEGVEAGQRIEFTLRGRDMSAVVTSIKGAK